MGNLEKVILFKETVLFQFQKHLLKLRKNLFNTNDIE